MIPATRSSITHDADPPQWRRRWRFVVLALLFTGAFAQRSIAQQTIALWPEGPPDANAVEGPETGNTCVSNISDPSITVYTPDSTIANGTAVLVVPGGGYRIVCIGRTGHPVARWLADQGFVAAVLKYRLPEGRHEIPLQDAQQAMRLMRSRAPEWNVSPDRIGAMGFSAGGHLAAMLGVHFGDDFSSGRGDRLDLSHRPDFLALVYPLTTLTGEYTHERSRARFLGDDAEAGSDEHFSAHLLVHADTPPTFLVHSSDDSLAHPFNSTLLYRALIEAGVPSELHVFAHGGHGYGVSDDSPARAWRWLALDWINRLP